VTLAEVFCIVGTLYGVGVFGTRVEESSGGALAADATLLAPAGPAFSIWSVIYLGLAGYTVWQWLPANTTSPRARAAGWLAAASMVLNAGWLLVTQQGWLWTSVGVIVALLVVLALLAVRLTALPDAAPIERVVVEGTFGLYLGWVAVATCANITATLVAGDVRPSLRVSEVLAAVVLVVAAVVGVLVVRRVGGHATLGWAVAGAATWGLAWIAVGRLADDPRSIVTGVIAALAALAVLAATSQRTRTIRRGVANPTGAGSWS